MGILIPWRIYMRTMWDDGGNWSLIPEYRLLVRKPPKTGEDVVRFNHQKETNHTGKRV